MRDWKTYKPAPSAPAPPSDGSPLVDQPQAEVADPKAGKPYLEITLDMNAEQLTMLFEDPDTLESGPVFCSPRGKTTITVPSTSTATLVCWRKA